MAYTLPVSYTTVSLVTSAYPAINSVSNINSAVVAQFAGTVEAQINAKISKKYTLPIAGDCPILTAIATRETIYRIAVQRLLAQFPPAQQGQHPMQVQHKEDLAILDEIASGEMQLIAVNSDGSFSVLIAADTAQMEIFSTTKGYVPTMHEGDWGGMVIDPNKLDDIDADRNF